MSPGLVDSLLVVTRPIGLASNAEDNPEGGNLVDNSIEACGYEV